MIQDRHYMPKGFTIVELMIVVVIMGVVAAVGFPGMRQQIAEQRVKESVNITESMLKQARSDALISHSEVKSVITLATATSAANITLTQSINGSSQQQSQNYNPNIIITAINSMPTTIRFTPDKRVYQDDTGTVPLSSTSGMGYNICYKGVSTIKYLLSVDAMTNVRVVKNGVCS